MFTFTTTNVINFQNDLKGHSIWTAKASTSTEQATFNVKGVGTFKSGNVVAIFKAKAIDPECATVALDFSKLSDMKDGDILRLSLFIGLTQASQDSLYANDMYYKGKPFSIDFVWKTDAKTTVEKLVKTINKYQLLVYSQKILDVYYNDATIAFEATNEYQRFVKVNVEKLDESAYFGMGSYDVIYSLEDLDEVESADELVEKDDSGNITSLNEGLFVGKEGFGTFSWILHNLRLPTCARTRAFAPNQEEAPILGAKYDQYTIIMCANRGPLGMNAVGDNTKSVTTHVFFVKSDLSDAFESALESSLVQDGVEITDYDDGTKIVPDLIGDEISLTREIRNASKSTNP